MRQSIRRAKQSEEGFTLIELLIVIVILGILAAIVVFAVGGITDRGQTSACKTDKRTLQTAEEANYARDSTYASEATLVSNRFLQAESTLYNITSFTSSTYTIGLAPSSPCT